MCSLPLSPGLELTEAAFEVSAQTLHGSPASSASFLARVGEKTPISAGSAADGNTAGDSSVATPRLWFPSGLHWYLLLNIPVPSRPALTLCVWMQGLGSTLCRLHPGSITWSSSPKLTAQVSGRGVRNWGSVLDHIHFCEHQLRLQGGEAW